MTTSVTSWQNIIQKIEIEIELMIWSYENMQKISKNFQKKKFKNFQLFNLLQYLHSNCVSVERKKLSLRLKINFRKIQTNYRNFTGNFRVSISSKVTVYNSNKK